MDIQKIREDFPILSRTVYGKPLVYFDNGATTQKPRLVVDALVDEYYSVNANVHRGVHYLSQQATELHEASRETVRQFINARSTNEVVFTRGTTESINLLVSSFGDEFMEEGDEVILSVMEHHSNIVPWQLLAARKGILDRLGPKKIVIVSSSPQVRYPDYYGIDMAKMSEFIAFRAAVELLKERDMKDVIAAAYRKSKEQVGLPKEQMVNYVKDIYAPFTDEEISAKMVELLTPKGTKAKVEIVYQPLEGLHEACPHHKGDWYFSGNYPTPGGVKMVNRAFIDYIEQMYQF